MNGTKSYKFCRINYIDKKNLSISKHAIDLNAKKLKKYTQAKIVFVPWAGSWARGIKSWQPMLVFGAIES